MIKTHFDIKAILSAVNNSFGKAVESRVPLFVKAGEQYLDSALNNDSYANVTGNLRSSIGYGVYLDGHEMAIGGFGSTDAPKGDGSAGSAVGRTLLGRTAARHTDGLVLVTVAGMPYAADIEAEGRDVATGADLKARRTITEGLR